MADELTLRASLSFEKGSKVASLALALSTFDVAGGNALHNVQNVGITEEALLLGDVTVGGYLIGINRDATNFMEIRPGTGAADLIQLKPGDVCLFRLAPGATAPFVIADTGAVEFEYLIVDL